MFGKPKGRQPIVRNQSVTQAEMSRVAENKAISVFNSSAFTQQQHIRCSSREDIATAQRQRRYDSL